MKTNDEIIQEEIQSILDDIIKKYEESGRKVTGEFEKGLSAEFKPNEATIKGYVYLAGRGSTKKKGKAGEPTLQERILEWIKNRGIRSKKKEIKQNSLAYLIARKIHKEGTNKDSWLRVYEEVITPERIDSIIEKISILNVNRIVSQISVELEVLAKNV